MHILWKNTHRDNKQKAFAKELSSVQIDSFYLLFRAYGYLFNTTESEKSVDKIFSFQYCILRDEVYDMLVCKGLPSEYALRFCRVLLTEKPKSKYFKSKARRLHQQEQIFCISPAKKKCFRYRKTAVHIERRYTSFIYSIV